MATLMLCCAAQAQIFRAYVSAGGSDVNPCTLPQPCRLLPAALGAVADGGEIWILDSANYNTAPVNITKSVTILAIPGAVGSIVATGGDAIDIATAGVNVTLRNLVIGPLVGFPPGWDGIHMTGGASLVVDHCLIANLRNGNGISAIAVSNHPTANVRVINSTIRGNGTGVFVSGVVANSSTLLDVAESTIDGNGGGVTVISADSTANVQASVRNSHILQSQHGLDATSQSGGPVSLAVSNSIISNSSSTGIHNYGAGSRVWASGNTVSGNYTGFANDAGGLFESAGNNAVRNNVNDVSGAITPIGTM